MLTGGWLQVDVDQRARFLAVKPKMGSRNMVIATTTLDWRSSSNRASSMEFIFSVLNTTSDVVFAGDLNFDVRAQPESSRLPSIYKEYVLARARVACVQAGLLTCAAKCLGDRQRRPDRLHVGPRAQSLRSRVGPHVSSLPH